MEISRAQLIDEIAREIAAIDDTIVKDRVTALLVEPMQMRCAWDYGPPGTNYPCWKVAEDSVRAVGIVYCGEGFGPKCPWGLVWLHETVPAMGQDSGWFPSFRQAVTDILDLPATSLNV